MSIGKAIKKLRKDAGLSQQEVANKLGMARATYASLEVDRREPDLGELKAISQFYEIPMMDLVAEEGDDWPGVIHEPTVQYKTHEQPNTAPRGSNQKANPEKLREVLLYMLAKVGAKPNVGEAVLYKLLYFIDNDYYEKTGQSVTGLSYVRNRFGPIPTKAFVDTVGKMQSDGELEVISTKYFNNTNKKYIPVVGADLRSLNASELRHIDKTLDRLSDMTAAELSELSYLNAP